MVVIIYLDIVAIMPRGEFTGVHEQFFYYFPPPARIDPSSISTSVRLTRKACDEGSPPPAGRSLRCTNLCPRPPEVL